MKQLTKRQRQVRDDLAKGAQLWEVADAEARDADLYGEKVHSSFIVAVFDATGGLDFTYPVQIRTLGALARAGELPNESYPEFYA